MKAKKELIRIVRSPQGELSVDTGGKMPGRGAYICPAGQCLKRALKNRSLERALNMKITENVLRNIKEGIPDYEESK
jgi:predicted RNA-binding protein YlxR (DUF448 family)